MYSIRQSKKDDCLVIAYFLREADTQEVFAASGQLPYTVLLRAYGDSSDACYTVFYDDVPVGMFGVVRYNDDIGVPWLLGTDDLTSDKKEFYKLSQKYLRQFQKKYKYLTNFVDKRNKASIRWLRHLGFTFPREIKEYGFEKRPFLEFLIIR